MKETKKCKRCKKSFITYRGGAYCSIPCYMKLRWGTGKCKQCGKKAIIRFCSDKCRNNYWNKGGYQATKKKRFWERKIVIIGKLGGKCIKCGIKDIRVLDINHKDRNRKERPKNGVYTWTKRLKEWDKNMDNLELLCANCHRIHTWEQMGYGKY